MPIKTLSTRRTQAASAISSSAVSFNNPDGSGFAISGTGVTSNTTIKSVPVTVGLSSAASTTTVSPPVITSFNVASDSSYTTILDDVAIDTGGAYIKINGTKKTMNYDFKMIIIIFLILLIYNHIFTLSIFIILI